MSERRCSEERVFSVSEQALYQELLHSEVLKEYIKEKALARIVASTFRYSLINCLIDRKVVLVGGVRLKASLERRTQGIGIEGVTARVTAVSFTMSGRRYKEWQYRMNAGWRKYKIKLKKRWKILGMKDPVKSVNKALLRWLNKRSENRNSFE